MRNVRFLFLLSGCLGLFSCESKHLVLDFRAIEIPESYTSTEKDSKKNMEFDRLAESYNSQAGFFLQTDKQRYHLGESIELTFSNKNDKETFHFIPSDKVYESFFIFPNSNDSDLQGNLNRIEKKLISKKPAIVGTVLQNNVDYMQLQFGGLDEKTAKLLGYSCLKEGIKSMDSWQFTVYPPEKAGKYRFMVPRYSHDLSTMGYWGINRYALSNVFEIEE